MQEEWERCDLCVVWTQRVEKTLHGTNKTQMNDGFFKHHKQDYCLCVGRGTPMSFKLNHFDLLVS